ncbi:hypothetical protein V5O48_019077 [Marasmius crinis-equi]|uniref:Uncharacterized protein n=1 Tax=Marasmius crinis-equi TaxID=585013 RepID=A0ABR3EJH9_9AGAR
MSSSSPSKKSLPDFREHCDNLVLLAKGTLMGKVFESSTFRALGEYCNRNHFDLRERMSDALDDVKEGWVNGTGPASEPPRTVIEVIHLARDKLMRDFGLEEEEDDDDDDDAEEDEGSEEEQGTVANRPLTRASAPARRTDVDRGSEARSSGITRGRASTSSPKVPRIAVIAPTPQKTAKTRVAMEESREEELDELAEVPEDSDDTEAPEDFDFRPFLQSPSIPNGWFPWQDKKNVVHYGWDTRDEAPHALIEEMYDSCRVLLKQNVQDSWEKVDLERFFKSQDCLRCRKSSKTCIPPKSSDGIVTCVTCKSSSQGCSHNSMVPLIALIKKFSA